jgi:PAS domain-containing protein
MADRLRCGSAIPADWCVEIVDAVGNVTETVLAQTAAFDSSDPLHHRAAAFNAAPHAYLLLDPDLAILEANPTYLQLTMKDLQGIQRQHMFVAFPDNPGDPAASGVRNLAASLARVHQSREPDLMPTQRYDLERANGSWVERYWHPVNVPVLDEHGDIAFIVHHVEDVTETVVGNRDPGASGITFVEKARECERIARRTTDRRLQRQMIDIAGQWRRLSRSQ